MQERSSPAHVAGAHVRARGRAVGVIVAVLLAVAFLVIRQARAPQQPSQPDTSGAGADARDGDEDGPHPGRWTTSSPLGAVPPVRVPPEAPRADPRSPGSFEGTVVSAASGQGIAQSELTFSSMGEAVTIVSDASGRFRFDPREPGRWTLAVVTAPRHFPFAPEWGHSPVQFDARPGAEVRGIVVTLHAAEEYRGVVVDRERRPLAGVPVRILGAAAGETALVPLREGYVSGPDGSFTFVAPRDAVLEATRAGFEPARATVDFAAWVSRSVELRFSRSISEDGADRLAISGRVELLDRQSAGGALLGLWPRRWSDEPARSAVADADGRFSVDGVRAGRYRVRATYPGFAPGRVDVEAGAQDVVISLQRGGRLAGTVRTGAGDPVHPFTVAVRSRGQRWGEPMQTLAVVDPAGSFEMDGVPPGPARVVIAAPGRAPSTAIDVTIPEATGDRAWVEVVLSAGGTLQGRVRSRDTGAPLVEAEIEVEGQLDAGASALPVRSSARSGPDGAFVITGLPDRPLSLFVAARGHHGRVVSGIHVGEGATAGPMDIELTRVEAGDEPRVELVGIGVVLRAAEDGLRIARVVPGSGAAEVGLGPGDDIVRIEGRAVGELDFDAAVQLIRGPENSTITLVVRRRGAQGATGPEETVIVPRRVVRG